MGFAAIVDFEGLRPTSVAASKSRSRFAGSSIQFICGESASSRQIPTDVYRTRCGGTYSTLRIKMDARIYIYFKDSGLKARMTQPL